MLLNILKYSHKKARFRESTLFKQPNQLINKLITKH